MATLFLGGVPTEPDVKLLRQAFPSIQPGDEFSHVDIARVIACDLKSSRYRTVTTAWRKFLLANENLEVAPIPGAGFRCLTADERVTTNIKSFQSGTRKQARSLRRASTIRRHEISSASNTKLDHLNRFGARILEAASEMSREIAPPSKQTVLPRRPLAEQIDEMQTGNQPAAGI